jgi:hypothetical protein
MTIGPSAYAPVFLGYHTASSSAFGTTAQSTKVTAAEITSFQWT